MEKKLLIFKSLIFNPKDPAKGAEADSLLL